MMAGPKTENMTPAKTHRSEIMRSDVGTVDAKDSPGAINNKTLLKAKSMVVSRAKTIVTLGCGVVRCLFINVNRLMFINCSPLQKIAAYFKTNIFGDFCDECDP